MFFGLLYDCFLALLIGGLSFFCRFGFNLRVLHPHSYDWLLEGDMAQSFVGWLFFYFEPWHTPWANLSHYMPPMHVSLALTDSHPWFSALMKALAPLGEKPLQFIGAWLLFCFFMQALFALKIARLVLRSRWQQLLLTTLLTASPVLLYRVGHVSLCAHWLILASIYLCLRQQDSLKFFFAWFGLLFLASLTHPYFLPSVALFCLGFYLLPLRQGPFPGKRQILLKLTKAFLAIAGAFLGLALVGLERGSDRQGLPNFYGADVLGIFNPQALSLFLPELWKSRMGQYEGYSYLGLGVILLLCLSLRLFVRYRSRILWSWNRSLGWQSVALVSLALAVFSWGSDVRLAGHWVVNLRPLYELTEPLTASFRAIGRFHWAFCYVLTISSFVFASRFLPAQHTQLILTAAVALQLIDLSPYAHWKGIAEHPRPRLEGTTWSQIAQHFDSIVIYPPYVIPDFKGEEQSERVDYIPLAIFAAQQGLQLHSGAFAATSEQGLRAYLHSLRDDFESGHLSADTLYVLREDKLSEATQKGLSCMTLDLYHLCAKTWP